MSLVAKFHEDTHNIASHISNMSVDHLRLAVASANQFYSVQSYEEHLMETELNSHLINENDVVIFTTNKQRESVLGTADSGQELFFKAMGLGFSYREGSKEFCEQVFYPMTDDESKYLADDVEFINEWAFHFYMSAIVNNKKHLIVEYTEYFERDASEEEHSIPFLQSQMNMLKKPLLSVAQELGGKLSWSNEPKWNGELEGEFGAMLYIPLEMVMEKCQDSESFIQMMKEIISEKTKNPALWGA